MKLFKPVALLTIALGAAGVAASAGAVPLVIDLEDYTNAGGFFATVTIDDVDPDNPGTVRVSADIGTPNTGLTQGDVLGIFFDLEDPVPSGLSASNRTLGNPAVSAPFGSNGVLNVVFPGKNGKFKGNNNPNGGGNSFTFDFLVEVGVNGSGANKDGANQIVGFDLFGSGLSTASFVNRDVGLRVQSIVSSAFAGGSSKLSGNGNGNGNGGGPIDPVPVPSPAPVALLAAGLIAFGIGRRRTGGGVPAPD